MFNCNKKYLIDICLSVATQKIFWFK